MSATYPATELESITFDRDSETYRAEFDQEQIPASVAVTALLSAVRDTDPTDLPSLYESVDPDALDTLVRIRAGTDGDVTVSFTVDGNEVTVYSYGTIAVAFPDGDLHQSSNGQPALD